MMQSAMTSISLAQAQAAKRSALHFFEGRGISAGVGITRVGGEYAVKVNLTAPVAAGVKIPTDIDGVRLKVEVTGTIRAR